MRRIFGIFAALVATAALLFVGSGASEEDGRRVPRPRDLRQRQLPRRGRGGARSPAPRWARSSRSASPSRASARTPTARTIPARRSSSCGSPSPASRTGARTPRAWSARSRSWARSSSSAQPTQPRAPGTEPPPELEVIPDGEPGEGQRFLPVENNGKSVDLDLINNIMREPYPDRFRLILNELGIGLATRGEDLEEIIVRGNPALRETNELLALLKGQTAGAQQPRARRRPRRSRPLAREREHLTGFINNATVAGEATAERAAELEAGFQRMPRLLPRAPPDDDRARGLHGRGDAGHLRPRRRGARAHALDRGARARSRAPAGVGVHLARRRTPRRPGPTWSPRCRSSRTSGRLAEDTKPTRASCSTRCSPTSARTPASRT